MSNALAPSRWFERPRVSGILAAVLIAIGVVRIVSVLPIYTQTFDEPSHLAGGVEAVERGTYHYESLHTPLARSMIAVGPYLDGVRLTGHTDVWEEGNALLYGRGRYVRTLVLARLGILPFFILACVTLYFWTRRSFGDGPALLSLVLFSTTPAILAHSGVATTDMALTATLFLAVAAFSDWLDGPSMRRGMWSGAALAVAVLCKISALIFFPLAAASAVILKLVLGRRRTPDAAPRPRTPVARWIKTAAVGLVTTMFVVWAGYRFTTHALLDPAGNPALVTAYLNRLVGTQGWLHDAAFAVARFPYFPAPELFLGFGAAAFESTRGRVAYILGESRFGGWWYFFPVALAFKTPLAFLILWVTGAVASLRAAWARGQWRYALPLAVVGAILVISMPTKIQIGLRHVLSVYPFLALTAGIGAWALASTTRARRVALGTLGVLLCWQLWSTTRVHPDYLAYFNEMAGDHPEHILLDSDLDWGQDLWRLDRALRARQIDSVQMVYWGTADPRRHVAANIDRLQPDRPRAGWVAASLYPLYVDSTGKWNWLRDRRPVERVGKSINLYFLTPGGADSAAAGLATR
jgi:4-amino-4-deoxy-L-arabinose transferase-like glycosyltransferase